MSKLDKQIDFCYYPGGKRTLQFQSAGKFFVPLPPTLFVSINDESPYRICNFAFWVLERPKTLSDSSYDVLLPNVHRGGYLCNGGYSSHHFGSKNAMHNFFTREFIYLSSPLFYGMGRELKHLVGMPKKDDLAVLKQWETLSVDDMCDKIKEYPPRPIFERLSGTRIMRVISHFRENPIIYETL